MQEVQLGSRTLQPHRQLLADGARVTLGKRALDILSVLAEAQGAIVTKDELLEAVWPGVTVEENALQVHIVAVRKALGPEADRLETIRGVGYRLLGETGPAEAPVAASGTGEGRPATEGRSEAGPPRAGPRLGRRTAAGLTLAAVLAVLLAAWWLLGGGAPGAGGETRPILVRSFEPGAGASPDERALASGITDELIIRLRRIPGLTVATAGADGRAPSKAFDHAYLLDGSVRSEGESLRVTARLADPKGAILWSDSVDASVDNLFDVQQRAASAIAGALSVPLDVGANAIANGGTTNPEAYAAYMRAMAHALDFDQSTNVAWLQTAIRLDPGFVRAHAHLAGSYGNQLNAVRSQAEADRLISAMDRVSAAAFRANPDNAAVSRSLYFMTIKDLRRADQMMARAEATDDGLNPERRFAMAHHASTMGRNREALRIMESLESIDPVLKDTPRRIDTFVMNRRYREAIELFDRLAGGGNRQDLQVHIYPVFWAKLLSGGEKDAVAFEKQFADMPEISAGLQTYIASMKGQEVDGMSLGQIRTWANERFGAGGQSALTGEALMAAYRGKTRLAVDLMRVAYERPGGYLLFYLWHPAMAEARKTREFRKLVADLGYPAAWRASGDWGDYCRPLSDDGFQCT